MTEVQALRAKTLALETAAPAVVQGPIGPEDAAEKAGMELEMSGLRSDLSSAIAERDHARGEVTSIGAYYLGLMVAEAANGDKAR
eukprot:14143558-Alexandrium_andersonii.AAC.1